MRKVGRLTQIYTLGDSLGFELNDGSTVNFRYGEHREGLLGLLVNLSEELGGVPTFEDVLNYPKTPHPNTYAHYFGSFDRAVEMVEDKLRFKRWEEGQAEKNVRERGIETNRREDFQESKGEDEMKRKKWTKGEIIALVMQKEEELGHFPTQKEFNTDSELPCYPTITNKFGGILELKNEIKAKKEREEQIRQGQQSPRSPEEEAIDKILATITEELEPVQEVASEESISEEGEEKDEAEEPKPIEEEASEIEVSTEECETGGETEKEEENAPVQTSIEVKDSETGKTMKIVITLEIFFPK